MSQSMAQELTLILDNEMSALNQLKESLELEAQALSEHDIQAIEKSASLKHSRLSHFQSQVKSRLKYLSTQKQDTSENGLLTLLNTLENPQKDQLKQAWTQIKHDFQDLIKLNEQNGMVIHHSQKRTTAALNILHGNKNQPNLYNQRGATQKQKSRIIEGKV